MFTGIIEKIGIVNSLDMKESSFRFSVEIDGLNSKLGDSVCVNGVCLTIEDFHNSIYSFSVSPETYNLTNLKFISKGDEVNIETSLTINKLISGHIVQGHIDTTSTINELKKLQNSWFIKFEIDSKFMKYIIQKGSITIDGVSLTINELYNNQFSVMIIPHTYKNTIFKNYEVGSVLNIETDILAKYIEKLGRNYD